MFSLFRHSPSDPHCIQGDWYLDPRCTVITWCPTQYPTNIQWCSRLRTQMLQTLQCQARGGVTASHTTHNFQVLFCKNNQIETISLNGLIQFEIRLKLVQNQQQKRFKPVKTCLKKQLKIAETQLTLLLMTIQARFKFRTCPGFGSLAYPVVK